MLLGQGDAERAAEHLSEALTLFTSTESIAAGDVLLGLAGVANVKGDPRRAARLLGASNRLANEIGVTRQQYEASLYQDTLAAVLATLGAQATAQLLAAGEQLPRDEAVAYSLEAETSPNTG